MEIKTFSIVIPVYNEEKTIEETISLVNAVKLDAIQKEIILVNDGSRDRTGEILAKYNNDCVILTLEKNEGKSSAVRRGLMASTGDVVVIQDADLEYDPEEYLVLLEPFIKGGADAVYGSRFKGGRPHRMIYYSHQVANQFITMLSNIFTGYNLSDVETGHKMFDGAMIRKIAPSLESKRFGFEVEVTAKLAKMRARVYEVGVSYYGRSKEDGKHIGFKDGVLAVWEILKYNVLR